MCVNQCLHFLHGLSCVVWVLNIYNNYVLKMIIKIITRCINSNEY